MKTILNILEFLIPVYFIPCVVAVFCSMLVLIDLNSKFIFETFSF